MPPEQTGAAEQADRAYIEHYDHKMYPEDWIPYRCHDGSVEYFVPFGDVGESGRHILRDSCDGTIQREDEEVVCGDDAAVRRFNDSGIESYCLRHAPEEWLAALDGNPHLDDTLIDLRQPCEKMVKSDMSTRPDPEDVGSEKKGRESVGRPPGVHQCEDRAFVLVTDGERFGKAFCRRHARDMWYRGLQVLTGDPRTSAKDRLVNVDAWPDDISQEDALWVDIPSGRSFESHADWMQDARVSGEYASVDEAEEHLAVLDGEGGLVKRA